MSTRSNTWSAPRRQSSVALGLALALAACSGGGGPDATSLAVSPESIEFVAVLDGTAPPPQSLTVTYRGDGIVAGYPPDAIVPEWLTGEIAGSGASPARITLRVTSTQLALGTHATTLRVVTGRTDGSDLVMTDVPIRYHVRRGASASATALAFSAVEGQAPESQRFTVSSDLLPYTLTVSVASVGGHPSDWLVAPSSAVSLSDGPVEIQVGAAPRQAGSYAAELVLSDPAGPRIRIPVSFDVSRAATAPDSVSLRVTEAAGWPDLERTIAIEPAIGAALGGAYRWTLASDAQWITATPSEGDLSAPASVQLRLDPDRLWELSNGVHSARLTFTFVEIGAAPLEVPVTLELALAPALSADAPTPFSVDRASTPADLVQTIQVSSNLGDAFAGRGGWTATPRAHLDWLSVSPGTAQGELLLRIPAERLATLPNGTLGGFLEVSPLSSRVEGRTPSVHLTMNLPAAGRVAPHVTWVDRSDEVIVRGTGFAPGATMPVSFGGATVEGRVVSWHEIRAHAPAATTPGTVRVSIPNALGIDRGGAELTVLPEPGHAAVSIPIPWPCVAMTLDAQRRSVILVGNQEVRAFRLDGTSWTEQAVAIPLASGAALIDDGGSLLVTSGDTSVWDELLELDPATLAIRQRWTITDFYGRYSMPAPLNDGRVLIVNSDQWADTVWYPTLNAGPRLRVFGSFVLVPRNRSRVFVGGRFRAYTVDPLEETPREREPLLGDVYTSGVSGAGERVVSGGRVWDRELAVLGDLDLPERHAAAAAVSPDGAFAYTLSRNGTDTAWVLRRTDLRAPAGPYPADPEPLPFVLPPGEGIPRLAVSEDGGTLFVVAYASSGTGSTLHVVPLR